MAEQQEGKGIFQGDRDVLCNYIRYLANEMGLQDWSLNLADDPPPSNTDDPERGPLDEETGAMISFLYGRRYAVIFIAPKWMEWDPEELLMNMVHELTHCHLHGMTLALNNVQTIIPVMTMDVVRGAFRDANELATDGIATAWSRYLPLPQVWWEEEQLPLLQDAEPPV